MACCLPRTTDMAESPRGPPPERIGHVHVRGGSVPGWPAGVRAAPFARCGAPAGRPGQPASGLTSCPLPTNHVSRELSSCAAISPASVLRDAAPELPSQTPAAGAGPLGVGGRRLRGSCVAHTPSPARQPSRTWQRRGTRTQPLNQPLNSLCRGTVWPIGRICPA